MSIPYILIIPELFVALLVYLAIVNRWRPGIFTGVTASTISIGLLVTVAAFSLLFFVALFLLFTVVAGAIVGSITGILTLAIQQMAPNKTAKRTALFVGLALTGILSFHSVFNQLSDKFHACNAKELAATMDHPIPATYRSIRFDFPRDLAVTLSASADNGANDIFGPSAYPRHFINTEFDTFGCSLTRNFSKPVVLTGIKFIASFTEEYRQIDTRNFENRNLDYLLGLEITRISLERRWLNMKNAQEFAPVTNLEFLGQPVVLNCSENRLTHPPEYKTCGVAAQFYDEYMDFSFRSVDGVEDEDVVRHIFSIIGPGLEMMSRPIDTPEP